MIQVSNLHVDAVGATALTRCYRASWPAHSKDSLENEKLDGVAWHAVSQQDDELD
jgi:hypothetical protein